MPLHSFLLRILFSRSQLRAFRLSIIPLWNFNWDGKKLAPSCFLLAFRHRCCWCDESHFPLALPITKSLVSYLQIAFFPNNILEVTLEQKAKDCIRFKLLYSQNWTSLLLHQSESLCCALVLINQSALWVISHLQARWSCRLIEVVALELRKHSSRDRKALNLISWSLKEVLHILHHRWAIQNTTRSPTIVNNHSLSGTWLL